MMSSFVRAISTVNVRADHTQDQSTANPLTFQIGGKVLKSHGFAIETIFEQDPDDSSGIDELMRILDAFSPLREEMMAKWYDTAARWWFLKGGAGKTTFAPGATVKVGGKELECGHHLRALKKNLVGAEVVAADDAIKTRLAELRAEDPSGHDVPWPGLEVLEVKLRVSM